MKKILVIIAITTLFAIFSINCFASENSDVGGETVDVATDTVSNHTLLGRVWEFVESNKEELIDYALSAILLVGGAFLSIKNRKITKSIAGGVSSALHNTTMVTTSQNGVIDTVNDMDGKISSLMDGFTKIHNNEEARDRMITALFVEMSAVKQMLMTVYPNSKNLPQGVKDLINLENANCIKLINDDKALSKLYESVVHDITSSEDGVKNDE